MRSLAVADEVAKYTQVRDKEPQINSSSFGGFYFRSVSQFN